MKLLFYFSWTGAVTVTSLALLYTSCTTSSFAPFVAATLAS